MKLKDLKFADLQFDKSGDRAFLYRAQIGAAGEAPLLAEVPFALKDEVLALRTVISGRNEKRSVFSVRHDEVIYRVVRFRTDEGEWYSVSRVERRYCSVAELGLPQPMVDRAFAGLAGPASVQPTGLVIVTGEAGHGKSTTARALFMEAVRRCADKGYVLDASKEVSLEGSVEAEGGRTGRVWQIDLPEGEGYAAHLQDLARIRAPYTLLGDLSRAGDIWHACVLARRTGVVIATHQAPDIRGAIVNLSARQPDGVSEDAMLDAVANSLRLVIHQEIVSGTLKVQFLFVDDMVRPVIRSKNTGQLQTYINQQANQMRHGWQPAHGVSVHG